jgi:Secretion system C-terminal sorting domain
MKEPILKWRNVWRKKIFPSNRFFLFYLKVIHLLKFYKQIMKKTLLFIAFLVFSLDASSQLLNESFEGAVFPPTGWFRTRTGSGTTFQWGTQTGGSTGAASKIANAFLNTTGSGTREQWLVTEQLTPNATNNTLLFKARRSGAVPAFAKLSIRVSTTTQTTLANFTTVTEFTEGNTATSTVISTTLADFSVNLSAYNGQNIYVAFVWTGNQFDTNGIYVDDVRDIPIAVLSRGDFQKNSFFKVYPNPTKNNLTISFDNQVGNEVTTELFDITGKSVYKNKLLTGLLATNLELPNLESGVYFLNIIDGNKSNTQRIIIE